MMHPWPTPASCCRRTSRSSWSCTRTGRRWSCRCSCCSSPCRSHRSWRRGHRDGGSRTPVRVAIVVVALAVLVVRHSAAVPALGHHPLRRDRPAHHHPPRHHRPQRPGHAAEPGQRHLVLAHRVERVLGCGTLVVESAGETGQLTLSSVPARRAGAAPASTSWPTTRACGTDVPHGTGRAWPTRHPPQRAAASLRPRLHRRSPPWTRSTCSAGRRTLHRREVSRAAGVSLLSARKFWRALGFPIVGGRRRGLHRGGRRRRCTAVAGLVRDGLLDEQTALGDDRAPSGVRWTGSPPGRCSCSPSTWPSPDSAIRDSPPDAATPDERPRSGTSELFAQIVDRLEPLVLYAWRRQACLGARPDRLGRLGRRGAGRSDALGPATPVTVRAVGSPTWCPSPGWCAG